MDYKNLEIMSWLLAQLRNAGDRGMTFCELEGNLFKETNMTVVLSKRSFHNYQNELKKWFNVDIECSRPDYRYRLVKEPQGKNVPWTMPYLWALDTSSAMKCLRDNPDFSSHVVIDNQPTGADRVMPILNAIKAHRCINFGYLSLDYLRPIPYTDMEPYWLWMKDYQWYLLGCFPSRRSFVYPLARITNIELSDTPCRPAPTVSLEAFLERYRKQEERR